MDAEKIADKARRSISQFCMEECNAYCCRKGYLILKNNQVNKVTKKRKDELELKQILKKLDECSYSLYIGDECPSLKDQKCTIHKSNKRPETCRQFPLFIEGNKIRLSQRCLAVKKKMLYPYICRLLSLGFELQENDRYQEHYYDTFEKDLNINKIET